MTPLHPTKLGLSQTNEVVTIQPVLKYVKITFDLKNTPGPLRIYYFLIFFSRFSKTPLIFWDESLLGSEKIHFSSALGKMCFMF